MKKVKTALRQNSGQVKLTSQGQPLRNYRLPFSILMILTISIILLKFSVKNKQTLQNRAEEIQKPTIQTLNDNIRDFINGSEQYSEDNLKQLLRTRKDLIEQALQNPKQLSEEFFTNTFLSEETITNLPEDIKAGGLHERYIKDLQGTIETTVIDNFQTGESTTKYQLLSHANNKIFQMYCIDGLCNSLPRRESEVKTNGISLDNNLIIDQENEKRLSLQEASPPKKLNIAVIISEDGIPVKNEEDIDKIKNYFIPEEKFGTVANYYKTISYGQLFLSFDFYNRSLPSFIPSSSSDCNYKILDPDQEAILLTNHDLLIYVPKSKSVCNMATVVNNRILTDGLSVRPSVIIHEMGHFLGLGHVITESRDNEPFDLMSEKAVVNKDIQDDFLGHFNAFFKQKLNWPVTSQSTGKENIPIDCPGKEYCNYPIAPLEKMTDTKTLQILKIKIPDSSDFYFIEYRQPIGYDSKTPLKQILKDKDYGNKIFGGTILRKVNSNDPYNIILIDTTPETTNNYGDAFLTNRRYFYDQINKILITQISHDENQAVVRIQFDASPPIPNPTPTPFLCQNYNNQYDYCVEFQAEGKGCVWCENRKACVSMITNPGFSCE